MVASSQCGNLGTMVNSEGVRYYHEPPTTTWLARFCTDEGFDARDVING